MKGAVSANWKALAPLITSSKKKESCKPHHLPGLASPDRADAAPMTGQGELWFEVDEQSLRRSEIEIQKAVAGQAVPIKDLFPRTTATDSHPTGAGKYVAMDCEMVGVGPDGVESALARVSLVNYHGEVLLDTFVRPVAKITDYRTAISGVEPRHLVRAPDLATVQEKVWSLIKNKVLIGHSLRNDFRALLMEHPRRLVRDTASYPPFRQISQGKSPSLKRLAKEFLGVDIHTGVHDSADDARIAMLLYRLRKNEWENHLFRGEGRHYKAAKRASRAEQRKASKPQ